MQYAAFSIGQIVHHKIFDYRGVIYDVDAGYLGTDEWYEQVAKSRPPKDQPWYHVLVDGQLMQTYVAERNLELDSSADPIRHPMINDFFSQFQNGIYQLPQAHN